MNEDEEPPSITIAWLSLGSLLLICIGISAFVDVEWPFRRAALFLHLASLIAGFGAVLVADFQGALWLLGKRTTEDLLKITGSLHIVIWTGLVGLCISGVFLSPNILLLRTQIKMALVLIATLNGVWAGRLSKQLHHETHKLALPIISNRLFMKVMTAGGISQFCWWGATIVGFMATTSMKR